MAYKTPGVYVKEVSLLPPSVAEVETAIPAFIGYTEKAERKGEDLTNKPTRIKSLLEYQTWFGGPPEIKEVSIAVDTGNNYAVQEGSVKIKNPFYLYDSLRLFFDNSGGDCYIVSVGSYDDTIQNGNPVASPPSPGLRVGLKALEKYDEPTIILFPDAALLTTEDHFYTLQQQTLAQCAKLQDRVGVFDLFEGGNADFQTAVDNFRDKIGINNLKYGAAYTPWLYASYPREVDLAVFKDHVTNTATPPNSVNLDGITSDSQLNGLVATAVTALTDRDDVVDKVIEDNRGDSPTLKDRYQTLRNAITTANSVGENNTEFQALMDYLRNLVAGKTVSPPGKGLADWPTDLQGTNLKKDLNTYASSMLQNALRALIELEKTVMELPNDPSDGAVDSGLDPNASPDAADARYALLNATGWLGGDVSSITPASPPKDYAEGGSLTHFQALQEILKDLDTVFSEGGNDENIVAFVEAVQEAAKTHAKLTQTTLYEQHSIIGNMVENIKRELNRLSPSGAVAGLYAFVDRTRGVWKAPANVSLNSVSGPVQPIDHFDQERLNVDVNAGKSINAIRTFSGRGTILWGARTLAGNDNEWRYVSVRRFFNMVEESVKKSTNWAVFEPNAAPLWIKVKGMIDNYLIQKWREGALAGATPDAAFFVSVGLGKTMTAQDILEGRLIVEIGMAAVRPAEFIILKFSHKMQES
jgi:phage tail sheath protein FI